MSPFWMTAFLDFEAEDFGAGVDFWRQVTGYAVSEPRGDRAQYATLSPSAGDEYLRVQRLADGASRIHLDLHVSDPREAADRARARGASEVADHGYVVMTSPGGLPFCFVPQRYHLRPTPPSWPGGHTSLVDQVCLDIPPRLHKTEESFWHEITGWELRNSTARTEFSNLARPADTPLRILLQRLDDDAEAVAAHVDLATTDRDAEVARHLGLGAELVSRHEHWTALVDPTGSAYCVTDRSPETGMLT